MIFTRPCSQPAIHARLLAHPGVLVDGDPTPDLRFTVASGEYTIAQGSPITVLAPELNLIGEPARPDVVLAEPDSLLLQWALAPLVLAELLKEPPVALLSESANPDRLVSDLAQIGWTQGVDLAIAEPHAEAIAATVIAHIHHVPDESLVHELYAAAYRTAHLLLPADPDDVWDTPLVTDSDAVRYRIRFSPGQDSSLVTILFLGRRDGRLGAAGMIQMMNLIAGQPETTGLTI